MPFLLCGEDDRRMINDAEAMIADPYGEFAAEHGFAETEESEAFIRSVTKPAPVDIGLRGGERIDLGGRIVEILHTPGHSWGHLSVLDLESEAVMIGDAVLGSGLLTAAGKPAFPPTYRYVDTYRGSIARLPALSPRAVLTAHYPVYRGSAGSDFLAESLAYTDLVEHAILDALRVAPEPLTLLEVVDAIRAQAGPWPAKTAQMLVYPVLGHAEALEQRGTISRADRRAGRVTYEVAQ